MPYIGGNKYRLIESEKVKTKFIHGQGWKRWLLSKYYPLDCDELFSYTKQDYYWPRSSHLNYFEKPYIPPSREELYGEHHIFLEENIEISKEINEDIVIEEESD